MMVFIFITFITVAHFVIYSVILLRYMSSNTMYVKTDAGFIPVPAPATITQNDTPQTEYKRDEKIDPSLIKQMLLAVRRVYGDEAKQIQIKIHDPIPTSPGQDEAGFKDITPLTVTIYYAKNRVYTGTKKDQEGSKWIPRDEYIAMKKREREEKDNIQQ